MANQVGEIAYLKMVLDSLLHNKSMLENSAGGLNRGFLKELKQSVSLALVKSPAVDNSIKAETLNAIEVLIDNYAEYFSD